MHPTHQLVRTTSAGKNAEQCKATAAGKRPQAIPLPLLQEKCAAAGLDYEAVCAGQTVFQEIVNPNPKQPVKKDTKPDPGGPQLNVLMKCSQPSAAHSTALCARAAWIAAPVSFLPHLL